MKKRAFTLVELIIVIAIIAILATVVVTNLLWAQAKSRDAKRKSDIKTIAVALEAYKSQKGVYPYNCSAPKLTGTPFEKIDKEGTAMGCGTVIEGMVPAATKNIDQLIKQNYLQSTPMDPKAEGQRGYYYLTKDDGKNFKVISYLPELLVEGDVAKCKQVAGDYAENFSDRICLDYQVNSNSESTKLW